MELSTLVARCIADRPAVEQQLFTAFVLAVARADGLEGTEEDARKSIADMTEAERKPILAGVRAVLTEIIGTELDADRLKSAAVHEAQRWPSLLASLEEELRTQDNRITSDPIFMVQERCRLHGFDVVQCETPVAWIHTDGDDVTEASEPEKFKELEAYYDQHCKEPEDWTRTGYIDRWENVQPFLTEKAADEYIRLNHHRHKKLRTYVESGYRNPEWQLLRRLFGGELRALIGHAEPAAPTTSEATNG